MQINWIEKVGKVGDNALESGNRVCWDDGQTEAQTEQKKPSFAWRWFLRRHIPRLTSTMTSPDSSDPSCHRNWQNKHDTPLLSVPVCERWKWMWPEDQHKPILAKNRWVRPAPRVGPVNWNISIHTRASYANPSHPVLCVCVCVWERLCVNARKTNTAALNKAAQCVWTALLKQSLFLMQTGKKKRKEKRKELADWTQTWMSV